MNKREQLQARIVRELRASYFGRSSSDKVNNLTAALNEASKHNTHRFERTRNRAGNR